MWPPQSVFPDGFPFNLWAGCSHQFFYSRFRPLHIQQMLVSPLCYVLGALDSSVNRRPKVPAHSVYILVRTQLARRWEVSGIWEQCLGTGSWAGDSEGT